MKFLITRASDGLKSTQPPCEGARKLTNGEVGIKLNSLNGEFGIKLNSLEELMALAEDIKCPLVIYPVYDPSDKSPLPTIQIYDDDIE